MATKLKIVNQNGELMDYQGTLMVFNPNNEPQVAGMTERERAESILWLLERNATNGPFRLVEFEDMTP